jgi:hypothetical protein
MMPVRCEFDYRAICDLLNIPYEYTTGMRVEAEGLSGEEAFATMEMTLRRPLTKEEWEAIAKLSAG